MRKAVIFDLDGTLLDSIPKHLAKQKAVIKHVLGETMSTDYFMKHCNGQNAKEYYSRIVKAKNLDPQITSSLIAYNKKLRNNAFSDSLKIFPHVKELLKKLQQNNFKIALASSSPRHYVQRVLKNNDIKQYFDIIITSDDVKVTKPNPRIFLLARQQLGIPKAQCLIVEDALNGFKAARRSGIDCIALTTSLKPKEIPSYATIVRSHDKLYNAIIKS